MGLEGVEASDVNIAVQQNEVATQSEQPEAVQTEVAINGVCKSFATRISSGGLFY